MAESLGIGLVFKAIDKGLFKDLDKLASKIGVVKKASDGLQDAFSKLGRTKVEAQVSGVSSPAAAAPVAPTTGLAGVTAGANKAGSALQKMLSPLRLMTGGAILGGIGALQSALTGTGEVSQFTKDFDFLSQKMASVFNPAQIAAFQAQLKKGTLLGVSVQESTTIAEAFNSFGLNMTKATSSVGTVQRLVGRLGMDAQAVASSFAAAESSLGFQGRDLEQITNQVIAQGKAYGFVDNIKILPDLLNNAASNSARLGVVSAKTNKKVINDLAGLTARFRKMNLSQTEAVSASGKFNDQITDMRLSVERMRVGLEPLDDKIFGLTASLAEVGMGGQEAFDLLASGDMGAIEEKLRGIASGLSGDSLVRFREQLVDAFGRDFASSVTTFGKQTADAAEDAGKKLEKLDVNSALQEEVKLRENTFRMSEKTLEAAKQIARYQVEIANKQTTVQKNYQLAEFFQKTAEEIAKNDSLLGKVLTNLNNINTNGVYGLLTSLGFSAKAATKLAGTLELIKEYAGPLGKSFGLFGVLGGVLALAGKSVWNLGKGIGWVGKQFGKILPEGKSVGKVFTGLSDDMVSAGKNAKTMFPRLGSALSKLAGFVPRALGPIAGLGASIVQGVEEAKKSPGIANFVKGFLFGPSLKGAGLGQILVDMIGQSMKFAAFGSWAGPLGMGIGAAFGATLSIVKAAVENNWINTIIESVGALGYRLGNKLGEAVGYAAGWVVDKGSKALQSVGEKISSVVSSAVSIDWGKILTFDNLADQSKKLFTFLKDMAKGFVDVLMSPFDAIGAFFVGAGGGGFDGIKSGFKAYSEAAKAKVSAPEPAAPPVQARVTANQPGAPGASAAGATMEPAGKESASLLGENFGIRDVVQSLLDKIDKLADRPLQVKIDGDLGKFLKVIEADGAAAMARRGAG